jgi:hypothetical protein
MDENYARRENARLQMLPDLTQLRRVQSSEQADLRQLPRLRRRDSVVCDELHHSLSFLPNHY